MGYDTCFAAVGFDDTEQGGMTRDVGGEVDLVVFEELAFIEAGFGHCLFQCRVVFLFIFWVA